MALRPRIAWHRLLLCFGLLGCLTSIATAADFTTARVAVYFSPNGGAIDAVVREVNAAKAQVLVQAYLVTCFHCPSPGGCA